MEIPAYIEELLDDDLQLSQAMIDNWQGMIWSLARKYTDNHTLQKDLAQEGWIGAMAACYDYDYRHGAKLFTYAFIKARSRMQQYLQYKVNVVHTPVRQATSYSDPAIEFDFERHEPATEQTDYSSLYYALSNIPDEQSYVLKLRYIDGMTLAEVSEETGYSITKIQHLSAKGKACLRLML